MLEQAGLALGKEPGWSEAPKIDLENLWVAIVGVVKWDELNAFVEQLFDLKGVVAQAFFSGDKSLVLGFSEG